MILTKQYSNCQLIVFILLLLNPLAEGCDTTVDTMGCQFFVQSKNSSSCTEFDLQYCQWKVCDYYKKDSNNHTYCAHYSMRTSSSWGGCLNECCSGSDGPQTYETLNNCYEENKKIAIIIGAVIGGILGLALLIFLIFLARNCILGCFGAIFQCIGGCLKGIGNFFRDCFRCFPKQEKREGSEGQIYIISDPVLPKPEQRQSVQSQWVTFEEKFDGKQTCVICLKDSAFVRLQCSHSYHQQCIAEWIAQKAVCASCSKEITKMIIYCKECMKKKKEITMEMSRDQCSPIVQFCQNCS